MIFFDTLIMEFITYIPLRFFYICSQGYIQPKDGYVKPYIFNNVRFIKHPLIIVKKIRKVEKVFIIDKIFKVVRQPLITLKNFKKVEKVFTINEKSKNYFTVKYNRKFNPTDFSHSYYLNYQVDINAKSILEQIFEVNLTDDDMKKI